MTCGTFRMAEKRRSGLGFLMGSVVKLCVLGAGGHASRHIYPCVPMLRGAQVAANADLDEGKAREIAARYAIPHSYGDYRKMLAREKPDGVVVCVGPAFHGAAAVEIMRLGFHVYVEKPPADSCEQAARMLATQRETGKICMTAFKKRFAPAYLKARQVMEDARFGAPVALNIFRTSGKFGGDRYLLNNSIHVIDLAVFLFGRVKRAVAFSPAAGDHAISLEFANGAVGNLTLTDRMSYDRGWEEMAVTGSGGVTVKIDNSVEMIAFQKDVPFAAHKPEFVAGSSHSSVEMGFAGELQAFVDAIAQGNPEPDAGMESTFHTMQIIAALEKSEAGAGIVEIKGGEVP